jgi:hypothetical protein
MHSIFLEKILGVCVDLAFVKCNYNPYLCFIAYCDRTDCLLSVTVPYVRIDVIG